MGTIEAIKKLLEDQPHLLRNSSKRLAQKLKVSEEEVAFARNLMKNDPQPGKVSIATATTMAQNKLIHSNSLRVKSAWMDAKGELKYSYTLDQETELTESLLDAISRISPVNLKSPSYKKDRTKDNAMLEITLADIHFGRGDTDTLISNLQTKIQETIAEAQALYNIEEIVLYSAGDIFNSDGVSLKTTKGTLQRNTSHYEEDLPKVINFLQTATASCYQAAPTTLVVQPGNHSISSEIALGFIMESLFKTTKDVIVKHGSKRKVYTYGFVGLLFDHGELRIRDYNQVFAMEFPEEWGATKFREAHLGHWHQEKSVSMKGMKARYLPSPADHREDEWIYMNAYYNDPEMQSFIWHKEKGLRHIVVK